MVEEFMSTKIYNGYRIHIDIARLYDRLLVIAPEFQNIATLKARQFVANLATTAFDSAWLTEAKTNPLSEAFAELEKEFKDAERGIRAAIDFNSSLSLFPLTGSVLVLTHIESRDQVEIIRNYSCPAIRGDTVKFKDFSYWDSSDRPDDVTEEEFNLRKRLWEFVLGKSMVPAHRCLSFQLSSNRQTTIELMSDITKIEDHIPTLEERARDRARVRAFELYAMALNIPDKRLPTMSEITKMHRDFSESLETGVGREAQRELEAEIRAALKPTLTLDDLRGS